MIRNLRSRQHSFQLYFLFVYVCYLIKKPHEWHSLILLIDKKRSKATAMFIYPVQKYWCVPKKGSICYT